MVWINNINNIVQRGGDHLDKVVEIFTQVGTIMTAMTIVGGFYLKFIKVPLDNRKAMMEREIVKKRERKDAEHQARITKLICEQNTPINESILELDKGYVRSFESISELKGIAEQNVRILDNQERRLDQMDRRVIYLEALISNSQSGMSLDFTPDDPDGK